MEQKTICIDFDGVIHDYSKGWQGEDVFGQMIPNADTGTATLKKNGWTIIIFTTRKKTGKFSYISKFHIIISCKLIVYIVMCFYQETN